MITFETTILKFNEMGEKTGWSYIEIPVEYAEQLNPGVRKSFRVKGKLDKYAIEGITLLPMGEGNFIMAVNATMRKALKKSTGASIKVALEVDKKVKKLSDDFLACLDDAPMAQAFFKTLAPSHQRYFSNWIESAKTDATKEKRILQAIQGLSMHMDYGEMIRSNKKKE